jgi:CDP-paratose 2-epimerase
MRVLVTGSAGLIGSEPVAYFDERASSLIGIDNAMRADFFGQEGSTRSNLCRLRETKRHCRACQQEPINLI